MPDGPNLLLPGDPIGERYTVVEKIGVGGLGEVYKIKDEQGNFLACKVFNPKVVPGYINLAKIKATLMEQAPTIPGIVHPIDVLEFDGKKVVLSQLVEGANLRSILKSMANNESGFSQTAAGDLLGRILAILSNMPPLLVHGDLKPGNIIIDGATPGGDLPENPQIKITDFGTSRILSFSKFASIQLSLGNDYYYLPPEFISVGGRVGRPADIFALGVLFYETLSGQVPKKISKPLLEIIPELNPAVDELVTKALSKDPKARFKEFGQLRESLVAAMPDLPEIASPQQEEVENEIEQEDIFQMDDDQGDSDDLVDDVEVFGEETPARQAELEPADYEMAETGSPLDSMPVGPEAELPTADEAFEEVDIFAESSDTAIDDVDVFGDEGASDAAEDSLFGDDEQERGNLFSEEQIDDIDVFAQGESFSADDEPLPAPEDERSGVSTEFLEPEEAFAVAQEPMPLEDGPDVESDMEMIPEVEAESVSADYNEEGAAEAVATDEGQPDLPEEKPTKPAKAKSGGPWGTIIILAILFALIALVVWKSMSSKPNMPTEPTPAPIAKMTPEKVIAATPEIAIDSPTPVVEKKKADEPTVAPTPESTPEPTPDPTTEKLAALIALGDQQKSKQNYVTPASSNLLSTVKQIEKIESNHPFAKASRNDMVNYFIDRTQSEMSKENWDNATADANNGLKVDPKNKKLKDLLAKIAIDSATPVPVAEKKTLCPSTMRFVSGGTLRIGSSPDDPMRRPGERNNEPVFVQSFCMDRYEFPNTPGAAPKIKVSWYEAKAACESQGKSLCKETEWEWACKGPDNQKYPYGNEFEDTQCNTANKEGVGRKLAATGSWKGCSSAFGVYDLSGNVREWTSSRIAPGNPAYVVKGGSAIRPDWGTRCATRDFAMPGETSSLIGFRCCTKVQSTP